MNDENIEDLIPPIPKEAQVESSDKTVETYPKKINIKGADASFNEFLSNWVPPGKGIITEQYSLILVNKIEWQVVSEFKNKEELNHFFAHRPELIDKTVVIEKRANNEYFHEDMFTLRKFKSIMKDSPLLQKPINQDIRMDDLAQLLSASLSPRKT